MTLRDPMEKLAREICWLGFTRPKEVGCTKAQYWKRLPEGTRQNYRAEARRFAYLLDRIDVDLMNEIHMARADGEQGGLDTPARRGNLRESRHGQMALTTQAR